ncbi:MAG: DUF6452 family protein [Reichenbachiella sp.]|uniref:DUF6452 family protein n=1 Tax=Reichenbachiella sp. TaxID=2184521 RepID=UPI003267DCD0
MREIVIVCLGLGLLWACGEEPDCDLGVPQNNIEIQFYSSEDSTAQFMKFVGVTERSTDSVFYTSKDSLSNFTLNLNPNTSQLTYVFQTATAIDTLTISYNKQLEWLSEECGPTFFYSELEVLGSSFTYDLTSKFIDVSIDENIKIYN